MVKRAHHLLYSNTLYISCLSNILSKGTKSFGRVSLGKSSILKFLATLYEAKDLGIIVEDLPMFKVIQDRWPKNNVHFSYVTKHFYTRL
jgi:collagenase-like PrtC family protease